MTDEMHDARAAAAADTALNLFALSDDVGRAAMIGATIACAAALADKTPLSMLDDLREQMPADEVWIDGRMGERTRLKCRNVTRWYKGAQIAYVGRGNQG